MQLAFVPQRVVAGLLAVYPRAAALNRLPLSTAHSKTLDEILRHLEELDEFRHPKRERDQWVFVADLKRTMGWTAQWLTRFCRLSEDSSPPLFRTAREKPLGRWLIHWPSFERWLNKYRKGQRNRTQR